MQREDSEHDYVNGDNVDFGQDLSNDSDPDDSSLFSGIRVHGNLTNVSVEDSLRALSVWSGLPPGQSETHDYINQDVVDEATSETL